MTKLPPHQSSLVTPERRILSYFINSSCRTQRYFDEAMLSLSSLLNSGPTGPAQHPMDDRGEHYSYPPPWKGGGSGKGKKGAQSALSALTLLAFLFFLNILQSALQEQMDSNAPIIVMMTTTSTTTTTVEGQRQKRDEPIVNSKGDTGFKHKKKNSVCLSEDCNFPPVRTTIESPYEDHP